MTADSTASQSALPASMDTDKPPSVQSQDPILNLKTTSVVPSSPSDYQGHDRNEVTRLLTQAMYDLGYSNVAKQLEQESGLPIEVPSVVAFRNSVLNGEWDQAETILLSLDLQQNADLDYLSFLIRRQQYLELLEARDTNNALQILRTKISVLPYDSNEIGFEEAGRRRDEIHALTNALMFNPKDIQTALHWDGAKGQSRTELLNLLQELISADMMIPRYRLAKLLHQAKQFQLSRANYRIDNTPFSLCKDFPDDRSKFPLKNTHVLSEHTDEVWYISFSHSGEYMASASLDKTVIVWKLSDFSVHAKLVGHERGVMCVEWSPDDKTLLTSGHDKKAILWDAMSGDLIRVIDAHEFEVGSCLWLPSGDQFITGCPDSRIIIWDLMGNSVYEWNGIRVISMALTPDGKKLVVVCPESTLHVFDVQTREKIIERDLAVGAGSVVISKDSRYALLNLDTNEVQLWDLETYQAVRRYIGPQQKSDCVMRSCFGGPDENIVMSGSHEHLIYVWNRDTACLIEVLSGHVGVVNCVRFNPKVPSMFMSCGDDRTVRVWQPSYVKERELE